MKKKLIVLVVLLGSLHAFGQQLSGVKIKDLSLLVQIPEENEGPASQAIVYDLLFKASDVSLVNKVHVLLGTAKDLGNIRTMVMDYEQGISSGVFTLPGDYTIKTTLELTLTEAQQMTFLTLFVEDETGNYSGKLYFSLKPYQL